MKKMSLFILLAVALVALPACSNPLQSEDGKLKIGVLPILDVLPLYVAEQDGLWAKGGIAVELVPFGSAIERDAAFQAGQIDGEVNDLISTALLNKDVDRARAVRTAMRATPDKAMFVVLASGKNQLATPADLKGVPVGMSKNTVIDYMVDRLLAAEGVAPADITGIDVPKIPVRLELLGSGQVQAACLPEPLASLAVVQGARIVIDDRAHPEYAQSTLTVSTLSLAKKPSTVKRFLAAYEQAVAAINATPEKYRGLLIEKGRVPAPVQDQFEMPVFPKSGTPTESEVADIVEWMTARGLLAQPLAFNRIVNPNYLP